MPAAVQYFLDANDANCLFLFPCELPNQQWWCCSGVLFSFVCQPAKECLSLFSKPPPE